MQGLIVKGIGGFYYVKTEEGVYECKARGIFKKDGTVAMVGDIVDIDVMEGEEAGWGLGNTRDEEKQDAFVGKAWISAIHERRNSFIRPPVANIDCFLIVLAAADPEPNLPLIDRFLVMAEQSKTDAVLCINKCDLVSDKYLDELKKIYEGVYPLVLASAQNGVGIEELKSLLKGKTIALAGPSGVGKSTIVNALHPAALMETGSISSKTKRGKHTTRHAEIFETDFGAMIFDTPGFTSFDVLDAEEGKLQLYYPEFAEYLGKCRYDNCRHYKEPDCAVRQAVRDGKISKSRYLSYKAQIAEIRQREENKY